MRISCFCLNLLGVIKKDQWLIYYDLTKTAANKLVVFSRTRKHKLNLEMSNVKTVPLCVSVPMIIQITKYFFKDFLPCW